MNEDNVQNLELEPTPAPRETKDRKHPLKVYVTRADREAIKLGAKSTRLTVSEYLRLLGTNYVPKSKLDQEALVSLIKVHADQGRLGGLLKLWLSAKPNQGASPQEIRQVLRQIESCQKSLQALVQKL